MLLSGEDGEEFRAIVNRNTICLTEGCTVSAGYDFPEEFYSTTLLMPAKNASFLNMINDSSSEMSRCENCGMDGKKMTMRLIESTSDYHFVTVERTDNRKLDSYMNADTPVDMHGARWNLVAFAELEYDHYKVWVKAKETWICVSDLQVNSEKPHNSIEMQKFGLNLMLFKKVDIIAVDVDADQSVHLGNQKRPEENEAAEFLEDYEKRVGQQFPLLAEDGPCLELKNYGNDCFVNSIANILFSCPEIRKTIRSCTDSSKPLALILGKIFRREVKDAVELRRTLPEKYHTGQHDITDVFELLIEVGCFCFNDIPVLIHFNFRRWLRKGTISSTYLLSAVFENAVTVEMWKKVHQKYFRISLLSLCLEMIFSKLCSTTNTRTTS